MTDTRQELADAFRAEFGDILVHGNDGNWANVADWIATGARIPACGSFYPSATDTRCVLHKGHRGSHRAPWGDRVMAWPYDPRETTQPPLTADELATGQADVDALNAEFPDEPADGYGAIAERGRTARPPIRSAPRSPATGPTSRRTAQPVPPSPPASRR